MIFVSGALPAPAPLVIGPLSRLGRDRVRAVRLADGSWTFNYSIVGLDAPDLAELLSLWVRALEGAISPLRVGRIEITFSQPLPAKVQAPDGAHAFGAFVGLCTRLIDQVAPREPTTINLFWTRGGLNVMDCLNDWRLDLDPIRTEIMEAANRLIDDLGEWLDGVHQISLHLEHSGV